MTRAPGWQSRLRQYLDEAALWRFDPVKAHCAHFILGALCAVRETDPRSICEELGVELPSSGDGINAILRSRAGMRGLATDYFGLPPREDMLNACEGDIAVLDGDAGETLGVVEGGGVLCVASDYGLLRIQLGQAKGYWQL